ncbi:MAG: MFS transporter [Proteobacteria bacterium]|uniref:MFS transporter n=1 Tax=Aquabacterium sp. TaxID=1872578 RepID=UPI0035C73615|nr:MFS transporter [Pseudomonadota bacterium]
MTDVPLRQRQAHLLMLSGLVWLEYLQSVMASFASVHIRGGIGAAPEEFSLAAAAYAAVAIVMLFKHRVWVQRFGYRPFIRVSLGFFALGALLTGLAHDVPGYMAGRMVQAIGGSALFTGARVQVQHHTGTDRRTALMCFAIGIFLGAGLAPLVAAHMLEDWGWRSVFLVMVPMTAGVAWLVEYAMPGHEPIEHEQVGRVHAGATLALVAAAFLLQFVLERLPYDVFASAGWLCALGLPALAGVAWFLWHDSARHDGLIPYRHFVDGRFLIGLSVYFFCYVVSAVASYMTPVFLVTGLGFAVTSSGWLLGATSLCGLLVMSVHFKLVQHHRHLKHYLWVALAALCLHGGWMSAMSSEVTQAQLFVPLLLFNGVFVAVAQGTAAMGTFRNVDEKVFSQAYQVKNAMRELANATGVSVATVVLQMRSTLHYERLAEGTAAISPWYAGDGSDPLLLQAGHAMSAQALQGLAGLASQQATLMACTDFYWGLSVVAVVAAAVLACQRKFA